MTDSKYVFNQPINKDSFLELSEWLLDLNGASGEVIFCSDGGELGYSFKIVEMLNQCLNVSVSVIDRTASGGARIFLECKNRKSISQGIRYILIHHAALTNDITRGSVPHSVFEANKKASQRILKSQFKFYKPMLTKKQMSRLKKGHDVFLRYDQIKDIINKQNLENSELWK